jgi:hypothetical protein
MRPQDVMVVAPFNAQVKLLTERLQPVLTGSDPVKITGSDPMGVHMRLANALCRFVELADVPGRVR